MSITISTPPSEGQDAVRAGVNSLLTMYSDTRHVMSEAVRSSDGVTVTAPHPVYTAGVGEILAGTLPESAQLTGWRYFLFDGDNALAVAQVRPRQEQKGASFAGVNMGAFVGNMVQGVAIAEGLEALREHDYQLRLLHIPGIYIVAIWLYGGEQNIFILLPPVPSQLTPYFAYSTSELLRVLREPALERMAFDEDSIIPN